MAWAEMRIGDPAGRSLVFLPGFLAPPGAYRGLLEPLAEGGDLCVRIPRLHRPGPRVLAGDPPVAEDARAAAAIVAELLTTGEEVWLAGHSRGGQAAWLAAELACPRGLIVVDPVDGSGPRSSARTTARPPRFPLVPLIIGAGLGGRCAPAGLNHVAFAAAGGQRIHAVLPECGHADLLDGLALRLGRMLCGGGPRPQAARRTVTALMAAQMARPAGPVGVGAAGPRVADGTWPTPVLWC